MPIELIAKRLYSTPDRNRLREELTADKEIYPTVGLSEYAGHMLAAIENETPDGQIRLIPVDRRKPDFLKVPDSIDYKTLGRFLDNKNVSNDTFVGLVHAYLQCIGRSPEQALLHREHAAILLINIRRTLFPGEMLSTFLQDALPSGVQMTAADFKSIIVDGAPILDEHWPAVAALLHSPLVLQRMRDYARSLPMQQREETLAHGRTIVEMHGRANLLESARSLVKGLHGYWRDGSGNLLLCLDPEDTSAFCVAHLSIERPLRCADGIIRGPTLASGYVYLSKKDRYLYEMFVRDRYRGEWFTLKWTHTPQTLAANNSDCVFRMFPRTFNQDYPTQNPVTLKDQRKLEQRFEKESKAHSADGSRRTVAAEDIEAISAVNMEIAKAKKLFDPIRWSVLGHGSAET